MKRYIAAAAQMNSQPDLDQNLDLAYELIEQAAGAGARLVGLPENFAFLGDLNARMEEAEAIAERVPQFLEAAASEFGIYLLGGSYPVPDGSGKVYNRCRLLDPEGAILAEYDKIHLFDVDLPDGESYRESDYVKPGECVPITHESSEIGTLGLTVCYDLRFPELYRKLSHAGAEILCVPSAFTATTGRDHWEPMLRSRAIENTAFVLAPAQTGTHGPTRKTHGHSLIIDPWGDILADAGTGRGVAIAELDPARLTEVRRRIPSLQHRVLF